MVRRLFLLPAVLGAAVFLQVFAQAPSSTDSPRVIEAFRRIATEDLWPGFTPASTPVEFFDGTSTWLINHPVPPEGFHAVEGVFFYPGRHESVRANTGTQLNGVPTATADLSNDRSAPEVRAALLVHETFHVFEAKRYPKWSANEADLFTYPADNAALLALRRLETLALVRALAAKELTAAVCQAGTAMAMRARRFAGLPAGSVAYERGVELNEGLAQYVQYRSIGAPAALTADDFPASQAQVRQRGYASGQALALLLDRVDAGWKSRVAAEASAPLDELLRKSLGGGGGCDITNEETQAAQVRARRDVADFLASLDRTKQDFLGAAGVRLEVTAGKEPLWPQGFDPWNVVVLDAGEVLHTRMLRLNNRSGTIDILGRASLTAPSGPHPLFNGVRQVIVTGLAEPKVSQANGKVTIEAQGLKATFIGSLASDRGVVRIHLP